MSGMYKICICLLVLASFANAGPMQYNKQIPDFNQITQDVIGQFDPFNPAFIGDDGGFLVPKLTIDPTGTFLEKCDQKLNLVVVVDDGPDMSSKNVYEVQAVLGSLIGIIKTKPEGSALGIVLTSQPETPLITLGSPESQNPKAIAHLIKQICKTDHQPNLKRAFRAAKRQYPLATDRANTKALLLISMSGPDLIHQVRQATPVVRGIANLVRTAIGFNAETPRTAAALSIFTECIKCPNLITVNKMTHDFYISIFPNLRDALCASPDGDATYMTFCLDDVELADGEIEAFLSFLRETVADNLGVDEDLIHVIDLEETHSSSRSSSGARRLQTVDDLYVEKSPLALKMLIRKADDHEAGHGTDPFVIASNIEKELGDKNSRLSTSFQEHFQGIPTVHDIQRDNSALKNYQYKTTLTEFLNNPSQYI